MTDFETLYLNALGQILTYGNDKTDRTGTGTLSKFGLLLEHDMEAGFPLFTTKQMPFKTIVKELLWMLRGQTNIQPLVQDGCHIWVGDAYKAYKELESSYMTEEEFVEKIKTDDDFAAIYGELGPIYGEQWVGGVNQIARMNHLIKTNPDSRRMLLSSWNVNELDAMVLPPCHFAHQLYVYDGKIDLMWYQRSADMCLGIPFNVASYALLLMLYAKENGLSPGTLKCVIGDAHVYKNHVEGANEQISRTLGNYPLPKVVLADDLSFNNLYTEGFELVGYKSHPAIKYPLSN